MFQGYFPEIFKTAEVIPIYKSGSKSNVLNYRPISLLNPISKLFEKCIHDRLNNFFTRNKTIHENQFGFRKNCSTENALLKTVSEITSNLQNNETTISLFLDLRKAFETINHKILFEKLAKYGIRGPAFKLLKSFVSQRRQYVLVNEAKSHTREVTCGIPQGSILGPLIFDIYINDFINCSKFNVNLFADDAYLSLTGATTELAEARANEELINVDAWLKTNKLSLNEIKSTFIVYERKKSMKTVQLNIGNKTLVESKEVKYLGAILDKDLSWTSHIENVEKKVASSCWAISKISRYADYKSLKALYYATIHTHLNRGITCWGAVPLSRREALIKLQKRAIRYISKEPRDAHTTKLFHQLRILKLPDLYKQQVLIVMHKINNNSWRGNLQMHKSDIRHSHQTRFTTNQNYSFPQVKSNIGKNSFNYMGPKLWAEIKMDVKNLPLKFF